MSDSFQTVIPGESLAGLGNSPLEIFNQSVLCASVVFLDTSLIRNKLQFDPIRLPLRFVDNE